MATLYILTGLPGSGKSTLAKKIDAVTISSDEIREYLYGDPNEQGDPAEVFSYVNSITYDCLKYGMDVIYDATSLTRQLREDVINKFKDVTDFTICIYMDVPFEECLIRNFERSRNVPYDVMVNMNNRLEIPSADEPFRKYRMDV